MDHKMTLVADEGMRLLNPDGFRTECPYFLAANDELWERWKQIQKQGGGEYHESWFDKGWKITTRYMPNGGIVMTLDIRFDPFS